MTITVLLDLKIAFIGYIYWWCLFLSHNSGKEKFQQWLFLNKFFLGLFKKHIGSISVFSNYAYGHWNPKIVSSSSSSSVVITYFPAKRSPEVLHDINAKVSPLAYSRFFLSIRFWMIFTWLLLFTDRLPEPELSFLIRVQKGCANSKFWEF